MKRKAKRKPAYRCVKLHDKMFGEQIFIFIGSVEKFEAWCKKRYDHLPLEERGPFTDGCHITYENKASKERHRIIWLSEFKWQVYHMGLFVHELSHCVFAVLKDVGMKFSEDSEETYTTYLQRLTTEAFWKLR